MSGNLFFDLVRRNFLKELETSEIKMDKELADYFVPAILVFIEKACKEALETVANLDKKDT